MKTITVDKNQIKYFITTLQKVTGDLKDLPYNLLSNPYIKNDLLFRINESNTLLVNDIMLNYLIPFYVNILEYVNTRGMNITQLNTALNFYLKENPISNRCAIIPNATDIDIVLAKYVKNIVIYILRVSIAKPDCDIEIKDILLNDVVWLLQYFDIDLQVIDDDINIVKEELESIASFIMPTSPNLCCHIDLTVNNLVWFYKTQEWLYIEDVVLNDKLEGVYLLLSQKLGPIWANRTDLWEKSYIESLQIKYQERYN